MTDTDESLRSSHHMSPEEQWEEHNRGFRFDPPEGPPDAWPEDEYRRLADRVIMKNTGMWECQVCSSPYRSLRQARSHVEGAHMDHLVEKAVRRQEDNS